MEIYIITAGDYSDYHIVSVWETKEKAEEVVAELNKSDRGLFADIEVHEMNSEIPTMPMFSVIMSKDGQVIAMQNRGIHEHKREMIIKWIHQPAGSERVSYFMRAKDKDVAVKIANERRAQQIASDEWDAEHGVVVV